MPYALDLDLPCFPFMITGIGSAVRSIPKHFNYA